MIRDDLPSRYPVDFDQWPVEKRLDWMDHTCQRKGLIRIALTLSGYPIGRGIDNKTGLKKEELAVIILALDPEPTTSRIANP